MKKEVLFILILMTSFVSAQLADSPWPNFNGNNQRTGLSPIDTSNIDGTIKWVYEAGANIQSSPAIGEDGTIYVGIDDGYLYAFNPDGTIKWKAKIGTPILKEYGEYKDYTSTLTSPGIAKDGTIYTASRDQYLYAIDPNGKEKWRFHLDLTFDNWGSPAIADDGTIYMTSSEPRPGVIAVNPDGSEKWYFPTGTNMFNSVTLGKDGTVYAALPKTTKQNAVYAINPENGEMMWELEVGMFIESTLAIADDGTLYGGTFARDVPQNAGIYAISPDGKLKWYFETKSSTEIMSTPSFGKDGTIYVGADDGIFYALNKDGTVKWQYETSGTIESSATISDEETIYFGVSNVPEGNPSFYALSSDGSLKWTNSKNSNSIISSAAIGSDGTVYVGSYGGVFYAFGETDKPVVEQSLDSLKYDDEGLWNPSDEGVDCMNLESSEFREECDMYCYDNPSECPGYFGMKGKKVGFFSKFFSWLKGLF